MLFIILQSYDHAVEVCKNVGISPVFDECHDALDWALFRARCQYDMCATSDSDDMTPVCNMLAALSKECAAKGIVIEWLKDNDLKELCSGKLTIGLTIRNCSFILALLEVRIVEQYVIIVFFSSCTRVPMRCIRWSSVRRVRTPHHIVHGPGTEDPRAARRRLYCRMSMPAW